MARQRVSIVQPDYNAWRSIRIGMRRDEVVAILGEPPRDRVVTGLPYVTYGWMRFRTTPDGHPYAFTLGFDEADKVFVKSDPFNGILSPDGKPSKPEVVIPQQGARFCHYPRLLDIRWHPCSGAYPMVYSVELGLAMSDMTDFHDHLVAEEIQDPYLVLMFPGSQPGRIRVRARNELGVGEWSDYTVFDFSACR